MSNNSSGSSTPASSIHNLPPSAPSASSSQHHHHQQGPTSSASFFSYPVSHIANSLYRRFTDSSTTSSRSRTASSSSTVSSLSAAVQSRMHPTSNPSSSSLDIPQKKPAHGADGVFAPLHRSASPFQPPPLTPLTLDISSDPYPENQFGDTRSPPISPIDHSPSQTILSKAVAEEIRLLLPPRLQLADTWKLVYSLENDGVSLGTLYSKCSEASTSGLRLNLGRGCGFVMVVQDSIGGIFGAYLTDRPQPQPSFYGTGECFLWKASLLPPVTLHNNNNSNKQPAPASSADESAILANLPPPPSANINIGRSTTVHPHPPPPPPTSAPSAAPAHSSAFAPPPPSPSIRFKAFPYSGINDYLIFCQPQFFSVGGGDGKYGLWLDDSLEKGISSAGCLTFGNEALSEEEDGGAAGGGGKAGKSSNKQGHFEVVGVEIWGVG